MNTLISYYSLFAYFFSQEKGGNLPGEPARFRVFARYRAYVSLLDLVVLAELDLVEDPGVPQVAGGFLGGGGF